MTPRLPDRYELEVRLGADGQIEEWLATDLPLDRPVLLRFLPPGTPPDQAEEFLRSVRSAAQVAHTHIATVYAAGTLEGTTYSVSEWAGGVSLADRAAAGVPIPPEEFLPNAAGLSSALGAIHAAGLVHGAIDAEAILFSAAHPAKLTGFGRPPRWRTATEDVQALSALLETTLTGRPIGAAIPSQVVDAVSVEIDDALERGRTGEVDAVHLAGSLRTAPLLSSAKPLIRGWSWRWVGPAVGLFAVAVLLVLLGSSLSRSSTVTPTSTFGSITAPPASTPPSSTVAPASPTTDPPLVNVSVLSARAYDPFGTDGEHDELADRAIDEDFTTFWKTEAYTSPLTLLKDGVGLSVSVSGTVTSVEVAGVRDGTAFQLYWAPEFPNAFNGWSLISEGTARDNGIDVTVPSTDGGAWLVWFTDLPATTEGTYTGTISEVRFRS